MSLAVQWSGVLIAGAILIPEAVAELNAAQRTANLISFVLVVINMVVAPRYARLWMNGNVVGLRKLAHNASRLAILLVAPSLILIFVFSAEIMSMFGASYVEAGMLLVIFGVGHAVNVATGSVGYLLNMSGYEKEFRRITVYVGVFSIVSAIVLVDFFGAIGAATATAMSSSIQNLVGFGMVKKRLGFWPVG